MDLPEIHEAARLRVEPDEILVLRNTEVEIDMQQADDFKRMVRASLGLPNLKVLVLGRDWDVTVVEDAE